MKDVTQCAARKEHFGSSARIITEMTGPAICGVVGLLTVAIHAAGKSAGAAWGGLAAVFVSVIPMTYIARGVKSRRWSSHHVDDRAQRTAPLIIAIASLGVGIALLLLVHAPQELTALVLAQLTGLLVVLLVNRWWKISIHLATASGLLAVLTVLFGPWALAGVILLAAIAWSRTVLGAHTWPQVIVGAVVGASVAATLFSLLR